MTTRLKTFGCGVAALALAFTTACSAGGGGPAADLSYIAVQDGQVTDTTTNGVSIAATDAIRYGVNDHPIKRSFDLDAPTFETFCKRKLQVYRVDVPVTADTEPYAASRLRRILTLVRQCGGRLVVVLQTGFAWQDRTDAGRYPAADRAALYSQGYDRTLAFVDQFRGEPIDWELGNEINLLAAGDDGFPLFDRGWTDAEFDKPLMYDWAAVLRGMSDAIDVIRQRPGGATTRRVLNTTSSNFGFLDFMIAQGVKFEVIDYHYYNWEGADPRALYRAPPLPAYNLFKKLATYKRPVIIGEVNAAEIYHDEYANSPTDALTQKGFRSFRNTLQFFRDQRELTIEAVVAYEMWDEPEKPAPENRFGLMTAYGQPKLSMSILTAFAGGPLPASERQALAAAGLLPR
ncbi:hypothetical protein Q5H91_05695 [Sphingomonas sp. KR1UV-12]|uniref:Arabinogalactan endo-beta-1,4-galactanase n=1 Tax=Sphingomonas aurea TaxID=3063994 RepID=A0ABT9EIA4_9SPHN|nr:hypothetical protein [Sphingomonas sp. KR1UV-12]MDP1026695.1 hypothetical protein [Sphingomonas sp. KR1UV-12]